MSGPRVDASPAPGWMRTSRHRPSRAARGPPRSSPRATSALWPSPRWPPVAARRSTSGIGARGSWLPRSRCSSCSRWPPPSTTARRCCGTARSPTPASRCGPPGSTVSRSGSHAWARPPSSSPPAPPECSSPAGGPDRLHWSCSSRSRPGRPSNGRSRRSLHDHARPGPARRRHRLLVPQWARSGRGRHLGFHPAHRGPVRPPAVALVGAQRAGGHDRRAGRLEPRLARRALDIRRRGEPGPRVRRPVGGRGRHRGGEPPREPSPRRTG